MNKYRWEGPDGTELSGVGIVNNGDEFEVSLTINHPYAIYIGEPFENKELPDNHEQDNQNNQESEGSE